MIGMVFVAFCCIFFAAQNCHFLMSSFNENMALAQIKLHPVELVEYPCCVLSVLFSFRFIFIVVNTYFPFVDETSSSDVWKQFQNSKANTLLWLQHAGSK